MSWVLPSAPFKLCDHPRREPPPAYDSVTIRRFNPSACACIATDNNHGHSTLQDGSCQLDNSAVSAAKFNADEFQCHRGDDGFRDALVTLLSAHYTQFNQATELCTVVSMSYTYKLNPPCTGRVKYNSSDYECIGNEDFKG
ncbi:hypothetical protein H257_07249 [Aphanomyces astaci]|uniref:Uncharacterized protein n=1 Tax=Aphanomyces astaci TaxID=112090 RepID=W4GJS5_APHAT|nr:hypothetical protein H257_07249 [Aphanomyces astaci]ETV79168.1 hypothetical protein H257_07249 [Aphanomyces astaci]|eukprot:XP_009831009.1 hypothetical protein H257_07249 [Aphanomyces astaci]